MKIFLIIFIAIFLLVNVPFYFLVRRILPKIKWMRIALLLFFCVVTILFVASFVLRNKIPAQMHGILNIFSVTWLLVALYFLLGMGTVGIIYLLNRKFKFLPYNTKSLRAKRVTTISVLLVVALIMAFGYINYLNPKVVKLDVAINKKSSVESLKIVATSDIHLGHTINKNDLKRFVRLINSQNPDLILLMGDIFDSDIAPVVEQNMREELAQLNAKYGVYSVLGNHDTFSDSDKVARYLESSGIVVLQDSTTLLDIGIYIAGRKDKRIRNRKSVNELLVDVDKSKPIILLDHQPYNLENAENAGVDLQLSGHTHAGQVFPMTLIVKAAYEQSYGYLRKGDTHYFISSGLGLWGFKLRIGSHSEIVTIQLKMKN